METFDINKNINLKDYVMNNYVRYFDLTPGREMELNYLLGNCNAHLVDVEQFKEVFDLKDDGFFGVLKCLADVNNLEKLSLYGTMCLNEYNAQMENMRKSQEKSL